jgi:hypothetical protein
MSHLIEMIGRRFGRLAVLSQAPSIAGRAAWKCQCDCGNVAVVRGKSLRQGGTTSCGCAQRASVVVRNHRHGFVGTKEYRAWKHIKGRCLTETDAAYQNYGARGITLAPEWIDNFEAFLAHIGAAPSAEMTVERIDNDRGYEPGNVRWATRHEQARNTRRNVRIELDGTDMVLADACAALGVNYKRAQALVQRGGNPLDVLTHLAAH